MLPLANCFLALIVLAQDPAPARVPPRAEPDRRDVPAAPAPDPQVDAWSTQLVARLGDANRAIARSAEAGLIALGPMAVPALRKAADGNVPEVAERARHALEEIRLGPPPFRRRSGGPDGPPPRMRDGGDGDRPWPPPFPRERGDRRDGPQGGKEARDGRGAPLREDGARREGPPRDGERPDGPPRERDPRGPDPRADDHRDAGRRGADRGAGDAREGARRDETPPPRRRRRDLPRGEGSRRDGRLPPRDRDTQPTPPPRDDRHGDNTQDAR